MFLIWDSQISFMGQTRQFWVQDDLDPLLISIGWVEKDLKSAVGDAWAIGWGQWFRIRQTELAPTTMSWVSYSNPSSLSFPICGTGLLDDPSLSQREALGHK